MVLARRLLRPLALLVAASLSLASLPAAHAGGDDFEFGQKLAQARFFKLARRVYETMLSAPGASDTTKDLARYGMATLGYQEALSASARPDAPFAEVVKLYNDAADQIDGFAKKNPAHDKAKEARLLSGQIRLQLVTWCGDLLDRPDEMAERKTTAGDVTAAARQAVEAAVAHFEALKGAEGDLGQLATYHWTTAQYYRALTLDPGSAAQIDALKAAEATLDTYIMDHDGELLAVFAQDMLGLVLAERAKHAANEADKVQLYQKALTWFQTCIDQEYLDAGTLTVITNGYQHYGKACLDAGRIGTRNFLREGVDALSQMLQRVPSAGKTVGGVRALLVLGDLHQALGNNAEAVNVYNDASDRAGQIDQRGLANEANKKVKGAASGGIKSIRDITVLRKVAESSFAEGRWEEAIQAFQELIARAPATSQAFVDLVWPSWEKIAAAYKELGEPLSSAMAYDAIHDAWLAGQIPHKKGDENDANMRRAGTHRKRFVGLMEEMAKKTGSKVFQEAMKKADAGFANDYPDHPDSKGSVLRTGLDMYKAAREAKRTKAAGWRNKFLEAIKIFEGEARNAKSENQDPAAQLVVSAYYQMVYDLGVAEAPPEGLQAAEKGLAFSAEMLAFWASAPGQEKLKVYPDLATKRTTAVLDVRLTRGDLLRALKRWDEVLKEMGALRGELGEGEKGDDAQALVVESHVEKGDVKAADESLKLLLKRGKHPAIAALVGKVAGTFDAKFRELTKAFNAKNEELNGTREDRSTGLTAKQRAASARYNDVLSQKVSKEQTAGEHRRQIAAWRKDPQLVPGMTAKTVKELEEVILPRLDKEIAQLAGELATLDTTLAQLAERIKAVEEEIQAIIASQYEPLKEAVQRFDVGLQSQMDAGEKVRPQEINNIAARWYAAARNPKGAPEDWEKARLRYEQYIEHPDVKAQPDTDKDKRAALAKLGRVYSHFSEVEKDAAKRAEYVRKAILLLEATLAARPENNELMLGLLGGRFGAVVYESPLERGPIYRFIVPKVENAAALKAAIAKLGLQDSSVPLPKVGDEAKMVVYRRNLAAWKDAVEKMDPASLDLLFRDVRGSGLDSGTYRELGNVDREYRTSLAAAYAESGEDADLQKGEILLATLLQGALSVEDYSDEYWEISTLALRHFTNHSERLSSAGGVAAKASELRKRARQFITGRTSVASVPTANGVRDEWIKLIERLNRGLRAEGAPEISVSLERATPPSPAAAPAAGPAPAVGPAPGPEREPAKEGAK